MKNYTYLKRVKVDTDQLKKGMYVAELDKPWEASSFLFQGFPIETDDQLKRIGKECQYVYVDFPTRQEYEVYLETNLDKKVIEKLPLRDHQKEKFRVSLEEELPKAISTIKRSIAVVQQIKYAVVQGYSFGVDEVTNNVAAILESISRNPDAILLAIQSKSEVAYDVEHCVRVSCMSLAFGQHLGMSPEQLMSLGIGGMLFDIGKSQIPESILHKKDKLNRAEAFVLRDYPKDSFKILSKIKHVSESVLDMALSHQEREDGKGYPRHIPKERVSRPAKIISLIDTYDAIVSNRSYRTAQAADGAFKYIEEQKYLKFDPFLVDKFLGWIKPYPMGSLVEMASGEVGVVLSSHGTQGKNVKVLLITDEFKRKGFTKLVDLSDSSIHSNGKPYQVSVLIPEGSYNINLSNLIDSMGERKGPFHSSGWLKTPFARCS
ncbi:MAG: DUF3391 domain-containing protein [Gammaproteobacteria bacterium]|nr:DUF3391 domain-containing protein [Gammaproteobacteria bacterium]MDH5629383.1 DUF3391 domain-containing protein [Gammaproteobacteria bacterium]